MFDAHGSFSLELRGNILVFRAAGAWNKETAIQFATQANQKLKPIAGQPWCIFSHISNWELSTPDCNPFLKATVQEGVNNGLRCEAVLNTTGQIKLEQFNLSMPDEGDFKRAFFSTEEDALAWLKKEGFSY